MLTTGTETEEISTLASGMVARALVDVQATHLGDNGLRELEALRMVECTLRNL